MNTASWTDLLPRPSVFTPPSSTVFSYAALWKSCTFYQMSGDIASVSQLFSSLGVVGWIPNPVTLLASKERIVLSSNLLLGKAAEWKSQVPRKPTNGLPISLRASVIGVSIRASCPASKTNGELARKHTKAANAKHVTRQHLPVQSVCYVFYKGMPVKEGNENHSQYGQPPLPHTC